MFPVFVPVFLEDEMKRFLLAALVMLLSVTSVFAQITYKDTDLYLIDPSGVLYFDDSVTKIAKDGFRGIKEITSVNIPEQIVSIGENAFSDCPNLGSIWFSAANCKDLTDSAFRNANLYSIGIGGSVRRIPSYIFAEASGRINLYLGYSCPNLESIGDYAFYNVGIDFLEVPDSLTRIGENAFSDVSSLNGENNYYAVKWFRDNGFDLESSYAKGGFSYLLTKKGYSNYGYSYYVEPEKTETGSVKPVNQALEDFINTDIENIRGKKVLTHTPEKYYHTTWLSQDGKSGILIDEEGFLSKFTDVLGSYTLAEYPFAQLESNGTVKLRTIINPVDFKLDDNTLLVNDETGSNKYTKSTRKLDVRPRSYFDGGSRITIASDKTTMAENHTARFYLDGAFDEKINVDWYRTGNLLKDPSSEPSFALSTANTQSFCLYGLEAGKYEVYAVVSKDKTKYETNRITLNITKAKDQEKRFHRDGDIWNPKDVYLVGEKCRLEIVSEKPVKNVEWTVISLYGEKEHTLSYTEGKDFYFNCRNSGVYVVYAKTNFQDGTSYESSVNIVSTDTYPDTVDGFWIFYPDLKNFYNYIFPRRSSGLMIKDSKIYEMKDYEEDSSTRADYYVDALPIGEFRNGKIVSLSALHEFTYSKDRIHVKRYYEDSYEESDFIRVPNSKIKYTQIQPPTKKTLDRNSELYFPNWYGTDRTYTMREGGGIDIYGTVDDYVREQVVLTIKVNGKIIRDKIDLVSFTFFPEASGDYVFEAIATGQESGVTLYKKYTYHVVIEEKEPDEEDLEADEWPRNSTNVPAKIDPSRYYSAENNSSYDQSYSPAANNEKASVTEATDKFLDDIRNQLKTGIVKVTAENFTDADMERLNEVLREAENDFAIDFDECYGSYSTAITENEYLVCVKNAKNIKLKAFLDCPNIRKVTVRSLGVTPYSARHFAVFFGRTEADENKYYTFSERVRTTTYYYTPWSLESVIVYDVNADRNTIFFQEIYYLKNLEICGIKYSF